MTIYKRIIILALSFLLVFTTGVSAIDLSGYDLPEVSVPEVEDLKTPELSTDYNKMLEALEEIEKNREKKKLELPEVEKPENHGKGAFDVFKENYGDMWQDENRQLDRSSVIPDNEFFDAIQDFGTQNQDNLDKEVLKDKKVMSELLKKKLDTSHLRDLSGIKKEFMKKSSIDVNSYLAGTPKPQGWGSAPAAPTLKKPTSYGPSGSNEEFTDPVLGGAGKALSSVANYTSNYVNGVKNANKEFDDLMEELKDKKGPYTDDDIARVAEATKNKSSSRLKPITDLGKLYTNTVNARAAKNETEQSVRKDIAKQKAEEKHGKNNVVYAGQWGLNKHLYVRKDSLVGKALNAINIMGGK